MNKHCSLCGRWCSEEDLTIVCPVCGAKPIVKRDKDTLFDSGDRKYYVVCPNDLCKLHHNCDKYRSTIDAIKAWAANEISLVRKAMIAEGVDEVKKRISSKDLNLEDGNKIEVRVFESDEENELAVIMPVIAGKDGAVKSTLQSDSIVINLSKIGDKKMRGHLVIKTVIKFSNEETYKKVVSDCIRSNGDAPIEFDFNTIIPMPGGVFKECGFFEGNVPYLEHNMIPTSYMFADQVWGCHSNARNTRCDKGLLTISFETLDDAPLQIFLAISDMCANNAVDISCYGSWSDEPYVSGRFVNGCCLRDGEDEEDA